jgi:chemotaxis signal transduction protein
MEIGGGRHVAAGVPHVVEYLLTTKPLRVPMTPRHCAGLMLWRGQLIPVIDLAPLFGAPRADTRRAVVLAYQEAPGQALHYGALLVEAAPVEVWVSDDMAGPLPDTTELLRQFTRACFVRQDRAIPILDTRRLFTLPLPQTATVDPGQAAGSLQVVEDTLAQRVPPAGAESAALPGEVTTVETWKPLTSTASEAVATDEPTPYCMVIPFATHRPAIASPEPLPEAPAESSVLMGYSSSPPPAAAETDATAFNDSLTDQTDDRTPLGAAALGAETGDTEVGETTTRSVTIESFRRLQALEQRHLPPPRRWRRDWLVAAGIAVLVLVLVSWLVVTSTLPKNTDSTRDAAPKGIHPSLVPAAPAQPPR